VFLKEPDPILVILDDLEAVEPATFQFLLHAFAPFTVEPETARLKVTQPGAGAVIQYLASAPLTFRQWDGYEPPPSREFPNQWHVEAGTEDHLPALTMLTLIVPHRAGPAPSVRAERIDHPTAVGLRVAVDGRERRVAIRRAGLTGPAQIGAHTFTGAWAAW
jgi:hypothetical protein